MSVGIWVIGTFAIWIHTHRLSKSQINRCDRNMGPYRAVLDISESMREELGDSISAYSNNKIEKELQDRPLVKYVIKSKESEDDPAERVWHLGVSSAQGDRDLNLEKNEPYS